MNHSSSATARYANPAGSNAKTSEQHVCQNPHPDWVCASPVSVRKVVLFLIDGTQHETWLCHACESELNEVGHVVARVLSRTYNIDPAQLDATRAAFAEQADLWPTGF